MSAAGRGAGGCEHFVEARHYGVVGLAEELAVHVGGDLHGAVAEPAAHLQQVGAHLDPQRHGRMSKVVKAKRREPSGLARCLPHVSMPVAGIETSALSRGEDKRIAVGCVDAASCE